MKEGREKLFQIKYQKYNKNYHLNFVCQFLMLKRIFNNFRKNKILSIAAIKILNILRKLKLLKILKLMRIKFITRARRWIKFQLYRQRIKLIKICKKALKISKY